jgi:hypothetical protein
MNRGKKKARFVQYFAIWGCFSTGIVYFAIGVIAILSFMKIKSGGADEGSFLVFLDKFIIGKIFIWAIMLGMVGCIIWRIYEMIADPYGYGKDVKGMARRGVSALSSLADALIAYSAIQALTGTGGAEATGQPTGQRAMLTDIIQESWGSAAIMITGVITCIIAVVQIGYVIGKTYMEKLDIDQLSTWKKTLIHLSAWSGHFARGTILGIIGYSLIRTAISKNAAHFVNTDKAFDFIGDNIGHLPFLVVATGTIFYGVFMFAFGAFYDPGKD